MFDDQIDANPTLEDQNSFYVKENTRLREHNATLRLKLEEAEKILNNKNYIEGHDEPCYYCGKKCNGLSARPSLWAVGLCHEDEPGVVKWHHVGCVVQRLTKLATAEAKLAAVREAANSILVWYDRDGSVGGLCDPIKSLRDAIDSTITADAGRGEG